VGLFSTLMPIGEYLVEEGIKLGAMVQFFEMA
jgi:hypothetical protein